MFCKSRSHIYFMIMKKIIEALADVEDTGFKGKCVCVRVWQ